MASIKIDLNSTFEDFIEFKASIWVWRLCSPLLILFGTVGNLLSLLILVRKRLRSSPTMFFLAALAVVDIAVLYSGLLRVWLENAYNINIRETSEGMCRFHTFFVYFTLTFSVWIIVAVTIDRCIIVCAPFQAKRLSSLSRARKTVLVIAIILIVLHTPILFTQTLIPIEYFEGGIRCSHADSAKNFRDYVWPWVDFCVYCFVPFAIMIVCNSLIIRRISVSARRLKQHTENEKMDHRRTFSRVKISRIHPVQRLSILALAVSNSALAITNPICDESKDDETGFSFRPKIVADVSRKVLNRSTSLTVMLLVVSFVFMVLVLPITVFLIGFQNWVASADPRTEAKLELGWSVVNILQYTNNSVHFLLYCLTGPRFRREFITLFKKNIGQKRIEPNENLDKKVSQIA